MRTGRKERRERGKSKHKVKGVEADA